MKASDGFDARRLRPREQKSWRLRLGSAFAIFLALTGLLLALAGAISLMGNAEALGLNSEAGLTLLVLGGLALLFGLFAWRRCRRRMRQPNGLSMSPHLMRKRG